MRRIYKAIPILVLTLSLLLSFLPTAGAAGEIPTLTVHVGNWTYVEVSAVYPGELPARYTWIVGSSHRQSYYISQNQADDFAEAGFTAVEIPGQSLLLLRVQAPPAGNYTVVLQTPDGVSSVARFQILDGGVLTEAIARAQEVLSAGGRRYTAVYLSRVQSALWEAPKRCITCLPPRKPRWMRPQRR